MRKYYIANIGIIIKKIPIKAHYSIKLVKRYYSILCQIYNIITS